MLTLITTLPHNKFIVKLFTMLAEEGNKHEGYMVEIADESVDLRSV